MAYETPTTAEVTAYIESHYTSLNPLRVRWTILEDTDKTIYINLSDEQIKVLPFKEYTPYDDVKLAVAENALFIYDIELSQNAQMQFKTLDAMGQAKTSKTKTDAMTVRKMPISSPRAWDMIHKYVGGSRPIISRKSIEELENELSSYTY